MKKILKLKWCEEHTIFGVFLSFFLQTVIPHDSQDPKTRLIVAMITMDRISIDSRSERMVTNENSYIHLQYLVMDFSCTLFKIQPIENPQEIGLAFQIIAGQSKWCQMKAHI